MKLSPRESQVVRLMCACGYSHKDVATELGISYHTVKATADRARMKAGAPNMTRMAWMVAMGEVALCDSSNEN